MTKSWTHEEIEDALRMRREGLTGRAISQALGRSHGSVLSQLYHLTTELSTYESREAKAVESLGRPTAEMIADRDKRHAAPRSIVSWVAGDPPPGYSALDKKEQATWK